MRGLGHRLDTPENAIADLIGRHIKDVIGVGEPAATSRDWRHLDPTIFNQGATNCCVPSASSESLYLLGQGRLSRGEGPAIPRPSIRQGYYFGQLEDQRLDEIPIEKRQVLDVGMRARSLYLAWEKYGICSEAAWPFDASKPTEAPPFDVDVTASAAKLAGWSRAPNGTISQTFRLASDQCRFGVICIDVYENFEQISGVNGYEYSEADGKLLGGHALVCVGYRPGFLLIRNSWGDWADGGHFWLADDFANSDYVRDAWLLDAVPTLQ